MILHRGPFAILAALVLAMPSAALADFNADPPNAIDQSPAFAGQTRAPVMPQAMRLIRTVLTEDLRHPWGMALLPDGGLLISERPGQLRLYRDGRLSPPIKGLPEVDARDQGGLLDVAVAPNFAETRQVWFSFSEPRGNGENGTAVGTGRLSQDETALEEMRVIFHQQPGVESPLHFGSRLVLGSDGYLYVTTGERAIPPETPVAQDLTNHLGKVLRLDPATGEAAPGNPLAGGDAQPEIWTYGHRNIQAAALDGQGRLWTVEHGPMGGDELNLLEPGRNYGWPVISYGLNYDGTRAGQGQTRHEGMEQPVYYWDPVIAPSGMAFYEGAMFPEWRGDALIGGLQAGALVRLRIEGDRVTGEQRLAPDIGRVRDVEIAPDGAVLVLIDDDPGKLIRLTRRGALPQ
ncbi:PQQ-dependent sugar dehydrogenase [Paracoccus denitrificans]|jgi:glucose/arabinose dehydrogenase|uniref:Glucose sorbosone dehydrogenase n=2 Tax=Paracoccus denitrificans TaxID=266 RepID=A1BB94_PARDP|nr:PQQ-dependent sugar dehydrogenase [Paracoccus denitrificans]ABL72788.1 glucose sorbosone dehydrogenase [Paracoccus denitrificans PD1222]MBB4626267.1 glucose/arabinose dehydrogenase [Paracoccus denitrificans]MCU7427528.1 PQQ-dependent sugar dehydrogenase [Paracoccus denitrificans]QAR29748.1 PQQ-dependent sugar dehydrogenase [Paracoccus denitrificans]UPV98472.1 PQQ-dependent sugar dehydrogenase [Paracoccus denitrificans]